MTNIPVDIMDKIKLTAKGLPVIMTQTHEKHIITQDEYQEQFEHFAPREAIIPNGPHKGKVMVTQPVQVYWNHVRRLRKAWLKSGYDGVVQYVLAVHEITQQKTN